MQRYNIYETVFNAICAILAMGGFVGMIAITMSAMADVEIGLRRRAPAPAASISSPFDGPLSSAIQPGPESGTFFEVVAAGFVAAEE